MSYPIPNNETERLSALRRLRLLDTPPDPHFDAITKAAAKRFDVPIALVSLVDSDRQWFKSACGLDAAGTPRDQAFCTFVLMSDEVMVVEDATADVRFQSNPLVLGEPHIRFYAGAPLAWGEDIRLGTLCIIDCKPRAMSQADIQDLARLADMVSGEIWAWRHQADARSRDGSSRS